MKDYIITIIYSILIAALLFGGCIGMFWMLNKAYEDIYYAKAQAVEVNDQVVTAMTADGNLWEFESERDYFVNEMIKIRFNTNNTDTIYDDIIVGVQ